MGGVGHQRIPPPGWVPIGCTPRVHALELRAHTAGNATAPERAASRLAVSVLGLSRALWLDQWGYPQSRAGIAGVVAQLFPPVGVGLPSCVWRRLGFLAVKSLLSGSRCRGVLGDLWRRGLRVFSFL